MTAEITERVPDPSDAPTEAERQSYRRALDYMDLKPGTPLEGLRVDRVFLGSCTNARLEDLREAAAVARGRRVAPGVRAMVVPGSQRVKAAAEAEGLDRIFAEAGFEWRNPGCSMCLGMNEDILAPGERCASTSNRNFEGRQGRGGRTHLMSPAMAAAAADRGIARRRARCRLMQPFSVAHRSLPPPCARANVDTDQIIPKQFLKRIERTGFGPSLFHDWRYRPDGSPDPDFELNHADRSRCDHSARR